MFHQVFIISDGTGRTAEQTLKAALTQYETSKVEIHIYPNIRTEKQVINLISEIYSIKGLIIHTVVSKKLRDVIIEQCRLHDIGSIDIMGPLLAQLSHHFSNSPSEEPGIFHKLNRAYFQRIEAIEFTFRHDDGQRIEELKKAEIVLLGVSRTFKTPLSIYLAHKGWLVANVPIIFGLEFPDALYTLPPERVFCLTTSPDRLVRLRKVRDKHLGGATGDYAKLLYVQREINYALKMYRKNPRWSIINVTNKPIEEISSEILRIIRDKKK